MEPVSTRRRGRPRSPAPLSAAERSQRYRARLRARGVRVRAVREPDPVQRAVRFAPGALLTPGEQDVLRRFCGRFRRLPELPLRAAVFGSRARGEAHEGSDLDLAVFLAGRRDPVVERTLAALALEAQTPYWDGARGIFLKPVALFERERSTLRAAIGADLETIWRRPR